MLPDDGGELSHYFSIFYKLELEVGIVSLKTYTLDLLTSHLCYFFVCHANWGGSYTRDYLRKFTFKCEILHVIWTVALIAKSCSNGCFNLIWEKIWHVFILMKFLFFRRRLYQVYHHHQKRYYWYYKSFFYSYSVYSGSVYQFVQRSE